MQSNESVSDLKRMLDDEVIKLNGPIPLMSEEELESAIISFVEEMGGIASDLDKVADDAESLGHIMIAETFRAAAKNQRLNREEFIGCLDKLEK